MKLLPLTLIGLVLPGIVFANAPSQQEVIDKLIKNTARQIVAHQQAAEDRELAKLPDVLECDAMQWMSSCYAINKQAKKNPAAPVRVKSKGGVEINFPPGTASSVIRMVLEGSPEAAKEYIKEYDAKLGMYQRAANASQNEMWRIGGIKNVKDIHESVEDRKKPLPINTDIVEAFIFTESTCPACDRQLKNLKNLQSKYPDLKITVYQLDQNMAIFKAKVIDRGLKGRMLTPKEAIKVQKQGVLSWPTMFIDNNKISARSIYRGIYNLAFLEDLLMAASMQEVK